MLGGKLFSPFQNCVISPHSLGLHISYSGTEKPTIFKDRRFVAAELVWGQWACAGVTHDGLVVVSTTSFAVTLGVLAVGLGFAKWPW